MLTLTEVKTSTLSEQILDVFPSGSYALSGLLRLLDIVETESVPTAAVECLAQPRLLINPKFVAAHADTPEKLLMLVMHELHHVLLGHTTLFPRTNPTQNFVFDAVINGILCRMFPGAEYTAFFTDYYSATSFPECLLRPPAGWPRRVDCTEPEWQVTDPAARERIQEVHAALYSKTGASYFEVYQLLPRLLRPSAKDAKNISAEQADISDIPLLGEHRAATEDGKLEHTSPVLFDIVRDLVEQWPQPPDPINGRSLAEVLTTSTISPQRKNPTNRALLRSLICKVADQRVAGRLLRRRPEATPTVIAIPTFSRRGAVLQALGVQVLLYPGAVNWPKTIPSGDQVHVYLDVSGSMDSVLKALYGAVLDCKALVYPTVHLFSTRIADITLAELKAGKCQTTGGTDIVCVARHMAKHQVKRALIITDGWVGAPGGQHLATLTQAKLAVAYIGSQVTQTDLKSVANYTTILNEGVSS